MSAPDLKLLMMTGHYEPDMTTMRRALADARNERDVALACEREARAGAEAFLERVKNALDREFTGQCSPESEILRIRCAWYHAQQEAKDWKLDAEMYSKAWARELGGRLFAKTHLIDALVLTTRFYMDELRELRAYRALGLKCRQCGGAPAAFCCEARA